MDEVSDVATQRRAASEHLIERLSGSDDPVLAYKAGLLAGMSPESAEARALQARIPGSPSARALLRIFEQDEKTLHHIYRKWQGPHWTLTCLALIDYPPGDAALRPLVHRVYDWLFSRHFLESPLTAIYPGQEDRVRHCASMDGNAIWYSVPGITHPGARSVGIRTRPRPPTGLGRRPEGGRLSACPTASVAPARRHPDRARRR